MGVGVGVGVGVGACAARPSARPAVASAGPGAESRAGASTLASDYRFVVDPDPSIGVRLPSGGVGIVGAVREEVGVDGSVTRATMGGVDLMGGVPVPARLGGGYLFWSGDGLYRARTFTGALEPITTVPTNAIGVAFGHDRLLLFTPENPPRAFALNPPSRVPLSPPGAVDVAGAEDLRVVALDAVGRPLSSIDGGQHWQDVSATLPGRAHGVLEDEARVGFTLDRDRAAWLAPDGQFTTEPFAAWKSKTLPAEGELERLARAVMAGVGLSERLALVGEGNGVRAVELAGGRADTLRLIGAEGSSCQPLSGVDDGVAGCATYGNQRSNLVIVAHALGRTPRTEKTFERPDVARYGVGKRVVVEAACSGAPAEGIACVRSPGGVWKEADVRSLLGSRRVSFWLLGEGDGLAALAVDAHDGSVALIDPGRGRTTVWNKTLKELGESAWRELRASSFRLLLDGSVRGFLPTGALRVSPLGAVEPPAPRFEAVSAFREHALARDAAGQFWQITGDAFEWQQVQAPPDGVAKGATGTGDVRPPLYCTALGCTIEHGSGAGRWLRVGWPTTPPAAAPRRQAASQPVLTPPPEPPALVDSPRPALRCQRASSETAPRSASSETAPRSAGSEAAPRSVGSEAAPRSREGSARRPLEAAHGRELAYYDTFHAGGLVRSGANRPLRATIQVESTGQKPEVPFANLVAARAAVKVRYREPFDPNGGERTFRDSLAHWLVAKDADAIDERRGSARPVLSPRAGASDGVILAGAPFSLWAPSSGKAVPVRAECKDPSAFADGQGKLFLACSSRSGSTRVEDASGQTLFRVRPSVFARDMRREGMRFFAPGESTFDTPDVIALGQNGELALLRLSSGAQPATRDNPAWLLSENGTPIALAPWATLELGSSSSCTQQRDGYRAVIQTSTAWLSLDGAEGAPDAQANMSALVRWSTERVCLEAVELGSTRRRERLVARFVGKNPGAALSNPLAPWSKPEAATCAFVPAAPEAR